jgi:hypothetical protein
MKALRNAPAYAGWSNEKIGLFMWENFQEPAEKKADQGTQYWLYAPGENARLWDEFYEKGIMGLGWDKLGDIRQYETKEDIKKALVDIKGGDGSKKNDVGAIFDFLNSIRVGDYIIAKRGMNEIIGYGIVTSDYEFDSSRSEYQKIRKVDWKKRGEWPVDFRLVLKTLTNITDYNSEHTDFEFYHHIYISSHAASAEYNLRRPSRNRQDLPYRAACCRDYRGENHQFSQRGSRYLQAKSARPHRVHHVPSEL